MTIAWLAGVCVVWLALGPVPDDRNPSPSVPPAEELARLVGQRVTVTGSSYTIDDIAGEGKPIVGVVERRGPALVLVALDGVSYRLAGVLARPRIAGPGYKIWALGPITGEAPDRVLTPRRLGVLAPPARQ